MRCHFVRSGSVVAVSCVVPTLVAALGFSTSAGAAVISFQHGVGGYTGGRDTFLNKQAPNTNYGLNPGLGIYGLGTGQEYHALISFESIFGFLPGQIVPGSTINSATLGVFNTGITTPATGAIHQMLVPWIDTVVTWNSLQDGANGAPIGELDPVPAYSGLIGSGPLNVTSIVQNWSNGAFNFGFAFVPTSTGGIFTQSNENANVIFHPLLTIDYTVPEPGTLLALTCMAACIGRRRG
jgi:hypothetical protein